MFALCLTSTVIIDAQASHSEYKYYMVLPEGHKYYGNMIICISARQNGQKD